MEPHTIESHDMLQGLQVLNATLVTAKDLGSGTEVIGEVLSVLLPHFYVTTHCVDLPMERNVVGRPITCKKWMW